MISRSNSAGAGMTRSYIKIEANGDRLWYGDQLLHRTDGPAIERVNGYRAWWQGGRLHRSDGPAIEESGGGRSWLVNGLRHRTDGPAIEDADGYREWWLNGVKLTETQWLAAIELSAGRPALVARDSSCNSGVLVTI